MDQCLLLNEKQLDMLIAEAKQSEDKSAMRREKKALGAVVRKWSMPVHYKFDGAHGNVNAY